MTNYQASTGHHGQPCLLEMAIPDLSPYYMKEDLEAAKSLMHAFKDLFISKECLQIARAIPKNQLNQLSKASKHLSWWIAGLINLSDWLGSSVHHFPFRKDVISLEEYWINYALPQAERSFKSSGIGLKALNGNSIAQSIIPEASNLTPLQEFANTCPITDEPQLFILEDVPGSGKTEAALILAHRLLQKQRGTGLFMALPTMATANGIYDRIKNIYQHFFEDTRLAHLILAHSGRRLSDKFLKSIIQTASQFSKDPQNNYEDQSVSWQCSAWIADNAKKAFLADMGVGTIDQALLSVMPSKHQALRIFGLVGKVLIVDEVHAYDPYVYVLRLLKNLISFHLRLTGSVILLSASLPEKIKNDLSSTIKRVTQPSSSLPSYPLASVFSNSSTQIVSVPCPERSRRKIKVNYLSELQEVIEIIQEAIQLDQCVLWIKNTVQDAIETYELLSTQCPEVNLQLFHSRFVMEDRLQIEEKVMSTFGKQSTFESRKRQVLVATQVVEQSLDLDFDIVITDLAPMDLIIQRAGRLQRHIRDQKGNLKVKGPNERGDPTLYIYGPFPDDSSQLKSHWYERFFPRGGKVYLHHGQLWLTAKRLIQKKAISIPEDIRPFIEDVYSEEAQQNIPSAFAKKSQEAEGKEACNKTLGNYRGLTFANGYTCDGAWLAEEQMTTRLSEEPTQTLRLLKHFENTFSSWSQHPSYCWEMSEVRAPQYIGSQAIGLSTDELKEMSSIIDAMPDKGKGKVIIPFTQFPQGWESWIQNTKGEVYHLIYSSQRGLIYEKEKAHV